MSSLSEEQALVVEANAAFYQAFESLDMDRMDTVWLHTGDVKCIHPGWELLSGWETVRASWAAIIANTPRIRFELESVQVVVHGGIGWVECLEHIYNGDTPLGVTIATNLFQQNEHGRWLMVHHHASPFTRRMT